MNFRYKAFTLTNLSTPSNRYIVLLVQYESKKFVKNDTILYQKILTYDNFPTE